MSEIVSPQSFFSREGEQMMVEAALSSDHVITRAVSPGLIEDGDVLHTDDVAYVELST
jgi:hypothetical protein